jgi:hypothetical protein
MVRLQEKAGLLLVRLFWKLPTAEWKGNSRCTDAGQGLAVCEHKREAQRDRVSLMLEHERQEAPMWNHYNGMFLRHQHPKLAATVLQLHTHQQWH